MAAGGLVPASPRRYTDLPGRPKSSRLRSDYRQPDSSARRRNCTPASRDEWAFVVLALTFQRPHRCPACVWQTPLARHVADHERRVGEQDGITVSDCAARPADGLLDAACPASVQDLAVPVDYRHAGLVGHKGRHGIPTGKGQHR
jgi:hypothetical protein